MATNDRDVDASREGAELCARITTTDDGTTQCTVYPRDAPRDKRTTRWITAEEGAFLNLADVH